MSAADDWNSISSDPSFRQQPISVQNTVTNNFFNRHIAPNVPPEHLDEVKKSFYADAFKSTPQDQITSGGATKEAFMQTMKGDVPYLAPVAQALRTDIPNYVAEKSGQAGAAVERAGQAMGLPGTGKVASGAIRGAGAGVGAAIGTAGEMVPKKGWELGAQAIAEPVTMFTKALGAKVAPTLISKLTQIDSPIVQRAIERATQLGNKDLLAPEIIENAIGGLKQGVKDARSALGRKLGAIEDAVAAKMPDRSIPVNDIGARVGAKFQRLGYLGGGQDVQRGLPKEVSEIVEDFKNIGGGSPAKTSSLVDAQGRAITTPEVAAQPRSMTFRDGLNLRQKIDNVVQWGEEGKIKIDSQTDALLKQGRHELNERLKSVSDTFRKANDAFAKVAKDYDKLSADVLNGKDETVQRRITNLFKKDSIERKVLARIDNGAKDAHKFLDTILDAITAQKFRPIVNPTLERAATHTGGGIIGASGLGGATGAAAALGHPVYALGVGAIGAATSPRLNSLLIRAAKSPLGETQLKRLPQASTAALEALRRMRDDNGQ